MFIAKVADLYLLLIRLYFSIILMIISLAVAMIVIADVI